MKKQDLLAILSTEGGTIMGATRPASNVQLDKWLVDGNTYLIEGSVFWNPNTTEAVMTKRSYREQDIKRIYLMTELS